MIASASLAFAGGCGRIGYDTGGETPDTIDAGSADGADAPVANDAPETVEAPVDASVSTDGGPHFYLEAEDGLLSGGFTIGMDPTASAGRYIEPPPGVSSLNQPGAAMAQYDISVAAGGTYIIWGRIHGPDVLHNRFWIQVDGGTWYTWRITTGDIWFWDAWHDDVQYGRPLTFVWNAGMHQISIANSADGVRLDRLYITAAGDEPPGNTTMCNPPHSIEVDGGCLPSCGSQGGNLCGVTECGGRPTFYAYDCTVCCVQ
jgi:hypothetical protein